VTRQAALYEAEVLPGLKPFAEAELRAVLKKAARLAPNRREDEIGFQFDGPAPHLLALKKIVAVYSVQHFAIPRPKALLGHRHFQRLIGQIRDVLALHPAHTFRTFRFSAAGKKSAVFTRLKDDLQTQTGLAYLDDEADMVIRIRPARYDRSGWEALARLTPRPLSTREWRVADFPGALNATVAATMVELTRPRRSDRFLNLMCGSGTLLIERLARAPAQLAVGGDIAAQVLDLARQNIHAAGLAQQIDLIRLDVTAPPLFGPHVDVICADLPWGQLVGSRAENATRYARVLQTAAALAGPQARLILLTHQIKLMETILAHYPGPWQLRQSHQLYQGGLHPQIYLFHN
jgi:16S rRNA G966 N2-methylase RsmD